VLQGINLGLVLFDVLGNLVLLAQAILAEKHLQGHHRDGDEDT
jgi:hypothetical protein